MKAEVLVILFADQYSACPSGGQDGSCVPSMDTVGSGRAIVVHNGGLAEGTWERDDALDPFTLTKADGETLFVPAGKLWISVFPNGRDVFLSDHTHFIPMEDPELAAGFILDRR